MTVQRSLGLLALLALLLPCGALGADLTFAFDTYVDYDSNVFRRENNVEDDVLYVHGSPREPTREYIFNQDWQDREKMDQIFAAPSGVDWRICFTGHTHYPGIFVQAPPPQPHRFYEPKAFNGVFPLPELTGGGSSRILG